MQEEWAKASSFFVPYPVMRACIQDTAESGSNPHIYAMKFNQTNWNLLTYNIYYKAYLNVLVLPKIV